MHGLENVKFMVFIAVLLKLQLFWDITWCLP